MQGPGLPSYGAEYGYLADSGSVETIDYKTGSTTTAASSTTSYLSDRNLIDEIDNVAGTGTISKYDYTYNAIGQRTHVVNTGTAFSANAHNAYGYNDRRVEKEVFEWTGTWTSTGVERFVYDEWTQRGSAKMDSGKPEPQGRSAAGCPLGGKRVNLLLVLDGANSNQVLEKYTWGLDIAEQASGLPRGGRPGAAAGGVGGLLAVEQVSGSNSGDYVYFYDANGNVAQVLDWSTETIATHYDEARMRVDGQTLAFAQRASHTGCPLGGMVRQYGPFGETIRMTGPAAEVNPFRFSTKFQDKHSDLYYYGFRFYSPGQGRFLNRDPINEPGSQLVRDVKKEGDIYEELNLYAFVGNNAISDVDKLGMRSIFRLPREITPITAGYIPGSHMPQHQHFAPSPNTKQCGSIVIRRMEGGPVPHTYCRLPNGKALDPHWRGDLDGFLTIELPIIIDACADCDKFSECLDRNYGHTTDSPICYAITFSAISYCRSNWQDY